MNLEKPTNPPQTDNNAYYTPPKTMQNVDNEHEYYEENDKTWYHLSGRIGRLRYLTYLMVPVLLIGVLVAVLLPVLSEDSSVAEILFIMFIAVYGFYGNIIYPIRRLNDLNKTGWFCLFGFIPFVNIIFNLYVMFARGTDGVNDYGNPPRANRKIHYIGALLPIIAIIGILLAIAIPAYQDYTEKAQQQYIEMQQQ